MFSFKLFVTQRHQRVHQVLALAAILLSQPIAHRLFCTDNDISCHPPDSATVFPLPRAHTVTMSDKNREKWQSVTDTKASSESRCHSYDTRCVIFGRRLPRGFSSSFHGSLATRTVCLFMNGCLVCSNWFVLYRTVDRGSSLAHCGFYSKITTT